MMRLEKGKNLGLESLSIFFGMIVRWVFDLRVYVFLLLSIFIRLFEFFKYLVELYFVEFLR